jgi:aryl-alcohol dehydrogenase (NADP+)
MDHVRLGSTGLVVSRICLGTMTFGSQCDERGSHAILDAAFGAGVTFIDTADVYPQRAPSGTTEEIIGSWLPRRREDVVVASKCGGQMGDRPWDKGCSRKHILGAVEASLRRLGTDYLDLYQLHRFDPDTPIDESLAALDQLVRSGKVRYIGCSNWLAYQLALAVGRSELRNVARFDTVQPRYNLLHRAVERELLPLCAGEGIGVIPYNPLAGGLLTGKHVLAAGPRDDTRFGLSPVYRDLYWHEREFDAVEQIRSVAHDAGSTVTALSVAWVLAHPTITSAIVGASTPDQLAESLPGADLDLTPDVKAELDRITAPFVGGPSI